MASNYGSQHIEWEEKDPLERTVRLYSSTVDARQAAGKHPDPPEALDTDGVRACVSKPSRIDATVRYSTRDIYYRYEPREKNPYARAVVDFGHDGVGTVISWSRYEKPVSGTPKYINPRNSG